MPEPIPQNNTTTGGGEGGKKGGILHKLFEKHGTLWLIGIGAATLIILVMYARNQSSNAANAAAAANPNGSLPIDPATGIPYAFESASNTGLPGSQADANYQSLQSTENTNTGLLQSILNALQGQPPVTGGTGGTTGTGTPPSQQPPGSIGGQPTPNSTYGVPPSNPWTAWITPQMQHWGPSFLQNIYTGEPFLFEGVQTTIGAGGGGRVWEVPGKVSAAQFNATPIGPGQKQLLYIRPQ